MANHVHDVDHSHKQLSLIHRAKALPKRSSSSRTLRANLASILPLYRPIPPDGFVYTLVAGDYQPGDVVPLVYDDYFGPGNTPGGEDTTFAMFPGVAGDHQGQEQVVLQEGLLQEGRSSPVDEEEFE
ncbi:hypothetical protein Q9L58_009140 [Maublancomyces gigas]|uniref:Uncharacterized protein n=1 Tax=Discina gigas TaxID=1032678 RepID=A0ABR3G7R6_9PEZI